MKGSQFVLPFILSFVAAIGNALVTIGQKKATSADNPFLYGTISLFAASLLLYVLSWFYKVENIISYFKTNIFWCLISATGLVLLNIFLYLLYRSFGANYYTLYSILAIVTTSILASVLMFHEKWNMYYTLAFLSSLITIILFFKAKTL